MKIYNRMSFLMRNNYSLYLVFLNFVFFNSLISLAQSREFIDYHDKEKKIQRNIVSQKFINGVWVNDGHCKSFYLNGQMKHFGFYLNGKATGEWRFFYEDGVLKSKGRFSNGIQKGIWQTYFQSGKINYEGEIDGKIKKGTWTFYFENGNKKTIGTYQNDEATGFWTYFYEDDLPKGRALLKNGRGIYEEYYESGTVKATGIINNGLKDSTWLYYHENGKLKAKGDQIKDKKNGYWYYYNENETLIAEGNHIDDKSIGNWKYYYSNGKIQSEGLEKEGTKEGNWKIYADNGSLKALTHYENGKGIYKEYYENGNLKTEGEMINDKKTGPWKYYYPDGQLEGKCDFVDGQGAYFGFYQNGIIKMNGVLKNDEKIGTWQFYDSKGKLSGYYKKLNDSLDVPIKKDTIIEQKKEVKIIKKSWDWYVQKHKWRWFTKRSNEFSCLVLSINPAAVATGSLPFYIEFYNEQRLGYEIIGIYRRSPFILDFSTYPTYQIYEKGYELAVRQKFYNKSKDTKSMIYFAQEIRYKNTDYSARKLDSLNLSANKLLTAHENQFEYTWVCGDKMMQKVNKPGFTFDVYLGLGIGFRTYKQRFSSSEKFAEIFDEKKEKLKIYPALRFGFSIGYAF